ncbi:trigger factor [Oceanicola granulosus HTCC2516]|uniref:TVP38/TMEM64 family membrane protein n=1 Tax=Oceanicola granulosus (strain ATCC BAA-861 / DSM 15982 / KCTC 12143 / HTCC2516) TaxID=314256 RepID=Q2CHK7_OCEGH|nr:VTT domain-containing protein [Oceanicola granulosus]EAR52287.1 trigger factor [Oceanicola granulosus HTCC2516]
MIASDHTRPVALLLALAAGSLLLALLCAPVWWPVAADWATLLGSTDRLAAAAGRAGPVLLVVLMALAVVASPIPSGPIAMAAGAVYGVTGGGAVSIAGAFLGAMIAFAIARRFRSALAGRDNRIAAWICRPRSPTMLMLAVFGARLVPLISFDAVSYAAGLTTLSTWRFALATLLGVAPMGFAFAAMGAGVADGEHRTLAIIVASAVTVALPAAVWGVQRARGRARR